MQLATQEAHSALSQQQLAAVERLLSRSRGLQLRNDSRPGSINFLLVATYADPRGSQFSRLFYVLTDSRNVFISADTARCNKLETACAQRVVQAMESVCAERTPNNSTKPTPLRGAA